MQEIGLFENAASLVTKCFLNYLQSFNLPNLHPQSANLLYGASILGQLQYLFKLSIYIYLRTHTFI